MKTFAATKNLGKLEEMRAIFAGSEIEIASYESYADPAEGEDSYSDNALLKARALFAQLRQAGISAAALGDDSGLEVAALAGAPGVLSARYGGPEATWPQRREQLLAAAADARDRSAKFVCAMALVLPDGREIASYAEAAGSIAWNESGEFGFGYDPIFVDAGTGLTFAQLSAGEKNRISHRARAAQQLLAALADG